MNNRKTIQNDIYMVDVLYRGGMKVAAKNLLFAIIDDYQKETDKLYQVAINYFIEVLLPRVKDRPEGKAALEAELMLFRGEVEITWDEWLINFPGTSIEMFEDKPQGRTKALTKEALNRITNDDFVKEKVGLFYSPNGFAEEVQPGKHRRRTQNNVKYLNAFFIDLDGASEDEEKKRHLSTIVAFEISPSFIVETKNGFHVIWLLKSGYGAEATGRWKMIQKGLIERFKSDRACSDVSRLLRMPNSWHCKDLWGGGQAFRVKLIYWSPTRYSMEDFKAVESKVKKEVEYILPEGEGELRLPQVTSLIPGERHPTLKEEVARAYARVGTKVELAPQVRSGIKEWYQASCTKLKSNWEKEVDDYCDWVESNQFNK